MTDPTSATPPIVAAHNGAGPVGDALRIADRTFQSRLLLGTGGFSSLELLAEAIALSGSELVTVALRRIGVGGIESPQFSSATWKPIRKHFFMWDGTRMSQSMGRKS